MLTGPPRTRSPTGRATKTARSRRPLVAERQALNMKKPVARRDRLLELHHLSRADVVAASAVDHRHNGLGCIRSGQFLPYRNSGRVIRWSMNPISNLHSDTSPKLIVRLEDITVRHGLDAFPVVGAGCLNVFPRARETVPMIVSPSGSARPLLNFNFLRRYFPKGTELSVHS